MTDSALAPLDYYGRHALALFPIPPGQKNPTGIVASFALDCSREPEQWARWQAANPGCNWGVVAGPSRLIIVDIDTSDDGRDAAWALWCELCASWGLDAPAMPHVQSARGGWHVYFAVPADVDAAALRQPDAVKKRINIRAGKGFTVAAGSYYDGTPFGQESGPYVLLADVAPHPAPAALIAHCTRAAPERTAAPLPPGARDPGDVAGMLRWLAERDAFAAYEDWLGAGMALKLEFGDAGLDLWEIAHDDTVTPEVIDTKWNSFATDPVPGAQTLNSLMKRAHDLGWRGSIGKTTQAMFSSAVAQLASAAGAALPGGAPVGGMPMMAGQEELARLGAPYLTEFLNATHDAPLRPMTTDYPQLPEACSGHGLYADLRDCIDRIVAMGEAVKGWKPNRVIYPMAVLRLVQQDTFESVVRKLNAFGVTVPLSKIVAASNSLGDQVQRKFVKSDDWICDAKGNVESDNSDNVVVLLNFIDAEVRWNGWLERAEIKGGQGVSNAQIEWPDWTYIDDNVFATLRTRGNRTGTRFRPAKEFLWESLLSIARRNVFDPVLTRLDELAAAWDGVPRLSIWLTRACGVPCDPYHQTVGKNIIGGMVRRIRKPGCKHDTMAVFIGNQGTGKSTLIKMLAPQPEWFSDTVKLGDEAKELVLSLAGKCIVEISEMGASSRDLNDVKAMITRTADAGRTAYARAVSERPRRNIFAASTNDYSPLMDTTGNRRFLPLRIEREIDLVWLQEFMPQLIGEAAVMEARGATFELPREIWHAAAEHQEAARVVSDIETLLQDWFAPTELSGAVTYITASDLVQLTTAAGWRGAHGVRSALMRRMEFHQANPWLNGKRTIVWVRGDYRDARHIVLTGNRYLIEYDSHGRPKTRLVGPDQGAPPAGLPGFPGRT